MAIKQQFERVPGAARRYRNIATGEVISRRQYLQAINNGLTLEQKARFNKITNAIEAAARPARGRSSLLKKTEAEKEFIARARIEDAERKKELAKIQKELKRQEKEKARKAGRKLTRKKISSRLLRPGRYGARVPFNDYDEYVEMFYEAKATGYIEFYGLGVYGYDERDGKDLAATVFTMRTFTRPISEEDFYDAMNDQLNEWSYFVFTAYFMHLAFNKEWVNRREAKRPLKLKSPKPRKRKSRR